MKMHPRHDQVVRARIDMQEAVCAAAQKHQLTFAELVSLLSGIISSWATMEVREERRQEDIQPPVQTLQQIYEKWADRIAALDSVRWSGGEPLYCAASGAYICSDGDGGILKKLINNGTIPADIGKFPGTTLSLAEMQRFAMVREIEALRKENSCCEESKTGS